VGLLLGGTSVITPLVKAYVMEEDFLIDQVSAHTRVEGNPETPDLVRKRFRNLVDFLQRNHLTTRQLLEDGVIPQDDFCIRASDLTAVGLATMRAGYVKWLKRICNKNKDTSDVRILEKALNEVIEQTDSTA
jgi:hypothetical protein